MKRPYGNEKAKTKLYKTKHGWVQCLTKWISLFKNLFSSHDETVEEVNPDALDDEIYETDDTLPAFMMGMNAIVTVLGVTAAGIATETVIGPKVKADAISENASLTQSHSVSQSMTGNSNSLSTVQSERATSTNISSSSDDFNSIVNTKNSVSTNNETTNSISINADKVVSGSSSQIELTNNSFSGNSVADNKLFSITNGVTFVDELVMKIG